ncbi:MAG: tetratricopeptide repeat protein [Gammaproteobacteria bacterium]|jgi:Tfp pilus assembly protein FimV
MTNVFEYIITAILVAVVLFFTYGLANRVSRNRVARDFRQPEEILTAVDVYLKYGRDGAARELLKHGLERYPDNAALKARAAEIAASAGKKK